MEFWLEKYSSDLGWAVMALFLVKSDARIGFHSSGVIHPRTDGRATANDLNSKKVSSARRSGAFASCFAFRQLGLISFPAISWLLGAYEWDGRLELFQSRVIIDKYVLPSAFMIGLWPGCGLRRLNQLEYKMPVVHGSQSYKVFRVSDDS